MTIDVSSLKVGDKVRLRSGLIRTVIAVDKDDEFLPIKLDSEGTSVWYFAEGKNYGDRDSELDIIDTEPELDDEPAVRIFHEGTEFTPVDAWPKPITDRKPTEDDADEDGDIQRYSMGGWYCDKWDSDAPEGWQHTPMWKPKPKPAHSREEVLDILRDRRSSLYFPTVDTAVLGTVLLDSIITHLEGQA
jgi:hypothetical protein